MSMWRWGPWEPRETQVIKKIKQRTVGDSTIRVQIPIANYHPKSLAWVFTCHFWSSLWVTFWSLFVLLTNEWYDVVHGAQAELLRAPFPATSVPLQVFAMPPIT